MSEIAFKLSKFLFLRFSSIYGEKFTKSLQNEQIMQMWWEDWEDGLLGIDLNSINKAINYCKLNLPWAPSLAEFRAICEKESGMPGESEAMQAAIRRDFHHPIIKLVYDKIGSWDMQHDSEETLRKKFSHYYKEELANYRISIQNQVKAQIEQKLKAIEPQISPRLNDLIKDTSKHG